MIKLACVLMNMILFLLPFAICKVHLLSRFCLLFFASASLDPRDLGDRHFNQNDRFREL